MRIEVLCFNGCPNYSPALERLRKILSEEGLVVDVSAIEVKDASIAEALQFIGSPTIRIDGPDIETEARSSSGVEFACRRYSGGLPSEDLIRAALRQVQWNARS
jgi:hypothetical protein